MVSPLKILLRKTLKEAISESLDWKIIGVSEIYGNILSKVDRKTFQLVDEEEIINPHEEWNSQEIFYRVYNMLEQEGYKILMSRNNINPNLKFEGEDHSVYINMYYHPKLTYPKVRIFGFGTKIDVN